MDVDRRKATKMNAGSSVIVEVYEEKGHLQDDLINEINDRAEKVRLETVRRPGRNEHWEMLALRFAMEP